MEMNGVDVVEAAIVDCFRSYAALPEGSVSEGEEMISVRTAVPLPFFNGVPRAALDGDAEERIRETLAHFREKSIPFRWWITPSSAPANLIELLKANGFRHTYDAPGMSIELDTLREQEPIEGVEIRRIVDAEELKTWVSTFATGFNRPEPEHAVWHDAFLSFGFEPDARWRHFLALLDGEPVATATVCVGEEVGGIYHVFTKSQARGKGIGAAVTLAGLHEARAAGCRYGALQSSEMAFGVYKQLGFRHCCDLTLYDWRPEYDG